MDSIRLYKTVLSLSSSFSSLAKSHGVVSSIYLLEALKQLNISSIASAIRKLSILDLTFSPKCESLSINEASNSVEISVLDTTPSKYLCDIEIVLLTKFPKIFARSVLLRSIIKSSVIIPSSANGVSCKTKYLIVSTPYFSTKSSAYKTFPFDLLILSPPDNNQGCPKICFGRGNSKLIKKQGQ